MLARTNTHCARDRQEFIIYYYNNFFIIIRYLRDSKN